MLRGWGLDVAWGRRGREWCGELGLWGLLPLIRWAAPSWPLAAP